MAVPVKVQLIIGGSELPEWNLDPFAIDQFKQRCVDLLTGAYKVEEGNRCVLFPPEDPTNPFADPNFERGVSICGEVSIGIASVEVCYSPDP